MEVLPQEVGAHRPQVVPQQLRQLDRLFVGPVLWTLQEAPPRLSQDRLVTLTLQPFRLISPDLIDRFAELLHDVEPVQYVYRLREFLSNDIQVRPPHVATDEPYPFAEILAQSLQAGTQAGLGPLLGNRQEPSPLFADFRGRLTCLFHTQFPPRTVRFFLVFLAFERRDMGAL